MKHILVTGGCGYIGSELVRQLLRSDYHVRVVDNLTFGGDAILDVIDHPNLEFIRADVRDEAAMKQALIGVDGIAHLAAIVGDPACSREPDTSWEVNHAASMKLYDLADAAGVKRFIFASTCSNYGKMADENAFVIETSDLNPISIYAKTKVQVEQFLLDQSRENTCKPTCLRFATVYGKSPRMRFDLTVNEFTKEVALDRELVIFGEQFWRPYCHVVDLARAVVTCLEADGDNVAFDVFNVGDTTENYQKRMIADLIAQEIPEARIKYVVKNEDPRDYRVNFDKIRDRLGFQITRKVIDGIREVKMLVGDQLISDPDAQKYYNIPHERKHAA